MTTVPAISPLRVSQTLSQRSANTLSALDRFTQWGAQHPTAVIHPEAIIGERVLLGPHTVIGAHAVLGDECIIGAQSVVENGATIGKRTVLHPRSYIGAGCSIGDDCEIQPNVSVGCDGFAYAVDGGGRLRKIFSLGNVIIGRGVTVGANCAIDRAILGSTQVRSGVQLSTSAI